MAHHIILYCHRVRAKAIADGGNPLRGPFAISFDLLHVLDFLGVKSTSTRFFLHALNTCFNLLSILHLPFPHAIMVVKNLKAIAPHHSVCFLMTHPESPSICLLWPLQPGDVIGRTWS